VQKDEAIGAQWLTVAARQGNPVAQNRLAWCYAAGRGVDADPVEAAKWHMLASEAGRADPKLDEMVKTLSDEQRDDARARAERFQAELLEKQASNGTSRDE
jgi:hypothetical protein